MRNSLVFSLLCLFLLAFGQRATAQCSPDTEPPIVICKSIIIVEAVGNSWPDVAVSATDFNEGSFDNCSGASSLDFFIEESPASSTPPTTQTLTIGLGQYEITMWVVDEAGNANHCTSSLVYQACPGTAALACNDMVQVSIPSQQSVNFYPNDMLEGGPYCYSNMSIGINQSGVYEPFLTFTEADAGTHIINVQHGPSGNICWGTVQVTVDCSNGDVVPPSITAPADHVYASTDFEQFVFDLNDNASMDAVFGEATAFDACGTVIIAQSVQAIYDNCDRISQITRSFIAWDEAGNNSAVATQVIDVNFKYNIYLPADHHFNDPGDPAELTYISIDTTNLIAVSHNDLTFDLNNDGITDRIERNWSIINWCNVDFQQPFPVLPRLDTDSDGILGDAYVARSLIDGVFYNGGSLPQTGGVQYTQHIFLNDATCLVDTVAPTAVCNQNTVAQIAVHGPNLTILPAEWFDNASYDNCSDLSFAVEIAAAPSQTMPTTTSANFTAVGVYENVYLWMADAAGNTQYCNVTVEIIPPKCNPDNTNPYFTYVPLDTIIHSDDLAALNLDPQDFQQLNQYFGEAEIWDYCGFDTVLQSVNMVVNSCGGLQTLTRNFMAIDEAGNASFAEQTITVQFDFSFNLPADFHPGDAGVPQELTFVQGNGTQLATSYNDQAFEFNCDNNPDLIYRTWTLINWCSSDPNLQPLVLPNTTGEAYSAWSNGEETFLLENGIPTTSFGASPGVVQYTQIIRYNFDDTISLSLTGTVFQDTDASCDLNAGEPSLANWPVKAVGFVTGQVYHTTTDLNGIYVFTDICPLDTIIDVSLDVSFNYGQTCPTTWVGYQLFDEVATVVNIPVQLSTDCALMEVDLTSPYLRRCFANNYTVSYCNYSTSTIEDTWVEVNLDTFMFYNSSSIPGTLLSGNTYSFATGDLAAGQCGNFIINFDLSCEAELGQTHCTEARIYPDTLCPQSANWTGANIEVEGRCVNDEVLLSIKNTGNGDMAGPLEYIVVEEVLMFSTGSFNLNAGQTMQLSPIAANGATWRLEAEQAPSHPYPGSVSVALEGCDGINQLGLVNLFPVENPNPFIAVDCQENQGSFDPNDKQGFPVGYGAEHFINRNTDIEYLIRFQNTGTDTAFTVVVEDALSQYLDPASIRPGASSHPYSFEMRNDNTVHFTFADIMLPDSNINVAASQGFVRFVAKQKPNLALGSVIENTAAIYFDFNEPVTTNRVFHTIGENFIEVLNDANETANLGQPTVYPNPAFGAVTFALPFELSENSRFTLHDNLGKLARIQTVSGNKFVFERNDMLPGIYFYTIENESGKLFSGKVILK